MSTQSSTWYLQIHDSEGNVLLMNQSLGEYKKYSKFIDNKANKIASQFPTAKRWEWRRSQPYTSKVFL